MVEMEVATEKAVEITDIYTHNVEKRLDGLGTYLVFMAVPLLIIAMQLGVLITYTFFKARNTSATSSFSFVYSYY